MKDFNILILEDESMIALRIKQSLEKNNFNVIGIAQDSTKAIDFIQEYKVDLILADITIKGYLNGIETVKLIQESFNISTIFLTSHQEDKFLQQASTVNFTGYIIKPFIEENLIREVKLAYHRCSPNTNSNLLKLGLYYYDINHQVLKKDKEEIILSKNEKFFLHILIINRNTVVLNENIDQLLWNDTPVDDVSRRHLVFRIRKKLPELVIETIKGIGYKLVTM
jgi:DNA-binding response OmpR family regulator